MLKKTITYTDFNDVERTEDFYFNLTEAEVVEMQLTTAGGFAEELQRVIDANDSPTIVNTFKSFILKAYGEKTPDGKHFEKSDEISERFANTEAYSKLFMELVFNAEKASAFVNGVFPKNLSNSIDSIAISSKE